MTMFFAIEPVSWEDILVRINTHSLSFLEAFTPLPIILTFIAINQSADSVLKILLKITSVDILIGISVFAFAGSQLNY